jgi:hypothetical protein
LLPGLTAVDAAPTTATLGAWIGLRDKFNVGVYRWVQNNQPVTEAFWFTDFPAAATGCANYAAVATGADPVPTVSTSWETNLCSQEMSFICEMEPPCNGLVNTVPPKGK